MPEITIIADDLTGAADTGVQFIGRADPVHLLGLDPLADPGAEDLPRTLALYTDTRHLTPERAAQRVGEAAARLTDLGFSRIYKKIDSCLRGNIGPELDALLEAIPFQRGHRPVAFIAPAFPAQGRTTENDIHRVHGIPVAETEMGRDPVRPVTESRLTVLVAEGSRGSVGRIDLATLADGRDTAAEAVARLLEQGVSHITFDAVADAHLDAVADLTLTRFPRAILAGSAGLAAALARRLPPDGSDPPPDHPETERVLFVRGTASPVTARQVERLVEARGCREILLEPLALAEAASGTGVAALAERVPDWDGGLVLAIGRRSGETAFQEPERVCGGMAALAGVVVERHRPDALVLTGGDTAHGVLQVLGAKGMVLIDEILPGLARGFLREGPHRGRYAVTKAGAFGTGETLIQLYDTLKRKET